MKTKNKLKSKRSIGLTRLLNVFPAFKQKVKEHLFSDLPVATSNSWMVTEVGQ